MSTAAIFSVNHSGICPSFFSREISAFSPFPSKFSRNSEKPGFAEIVAFVFLVCKFRPTCWAARPLRSCCRWFWDDVVMSPPSPIGGDDRMHVAYSTSHRRRSAVDWRKLLWVIQRRLNNGWWKSAASIMTASHIDWPSAPHDSTSTARLAAYRVVQ